MNRIVVGLSNFTTKLRRTRVAPDQLLLLIPHCIQRSTCVQGIAAGVWNCARCGACKLDALIALSEKYGCRIEVASGGRLAIDKVRDPGVRAVVAVACNTELRQGIMASFPKAVLGVVNAWPEGPCKNTDVDIDPVEKAIQWFLRK
jgi:uncharacterized protein